MPMTCLRSATPSACERWNALRPMMDPNEPPCWRLLISSRTSSLLLAAPPEKITSGRTPTAPPAERRLDAVAHALRQGSEGELRLLDLLLRLGLLDVGGGGLDLDDV